MCQFGQVNVLPIWNFNLDIVEHITAQLRAIAEYLGTRIASTTPPPTPVKIEAKSLI